MNLIPLVKVSSKISCGAPLPWDVRDETGKLLLARGYLIQTPELLYNLLRRGVFVDAEEVRIHQEAPVHKAQEMSPPGLLISDKINATLMQPFGEQWTSLEVALTNLLKNPRDPGFLPGIEKQESTIRSMTEKHTDRLIYSVIRHKQDRFDSYGITHSIHVAAVCSILAERLKWPKSQKKTVVSAALTMNIAMIELQNMLTHVQTDLTQEHRRQIHDHPAEGVRLLKEAGVADIEWLQAVEQHHEQPGGGGYPHGKKNDLSEMSQLIRFADVFTAKYSARKGREPVPARKAAQSIYLASEGHPIASAILKEFGIYPPGCFVELESGETAVVIRRGEKANAPLVAVLCSQNGERTRELVLRDTALPRYTILRTSANNAIPFDVPTERLFTFVAE